MSSRSSVGAIVFVVLLVGVGLFAANRGAQKAPEATAPAPVPTAGETPDTRAAAPAAPEAEPAGPETTAQSAGAEAPAAALSEATEPSASAPPTDAAPDASAATPDAAASAQQATAGAVAGTGDDADRPAPTAALQAPTYDLVRVEPTGDAVIAGRASPGATIELLVNGKVVASTVANATGEWVLVLDQPLAPGDYDIALQASDADTQTPSVSQDRLAVSIPANGSETPMVALTRPNAPMEVLQKPAPTIAAAAPESGTETASEAARAPATETAAAASGKSDRSASAPTVAGSPVPAEGAPTDPVAGGETVIGHLTVSEDAPAAPAEAAASAVAPTETAAPVASMPTAKPAVPAAEQAQDAGRASGDTVPVSIEIAEAAGDTFRLQGMSKPGADVWIYLAGEYVGEAKASDTGRWTFEQKMAFEEGDYSIRVDQIANRAGAVATRAEVPFAFKRAGEGTDVAGNAKVAILDETEEGVRVLIRRGDNLWTIAHHFYGDGFSYANIYRENNGQIRNPHLIYPGQVFVMPGLKKKDVSGIAKDRAL